uniref:Uncharacterized protein n=1 Tax=Salix viminalis TaxID=40686 RepID=A0A6N2LE03_SALVM
MRPVICGSRQRRLAVSLRDFTVQRHSHLPSKMGPRQDRLCLMFIFTSYQGKVATLRRMMRYMMQLTRRKRN